MRKRLWAVFALAVAGWLPPSLVADSTYISRQATLASSFDLDGEAADPDQIVTAANGVITDSTSYTITADPDTCRLVDVTVTDANSSITVGTLTIDGFDCWGYPLRATFNLAGGSGVRTGTVAAFSSATEIRASGAYFSDVTSVSNGVVTGEGGAGDTIEVGYTGNSAKGWVMYGTESRTPSGRRFVDIFNSYAVNCLVKNGAATTDVVGVSTSTTACFQNVSVGDLIQFNIAGDQIVRRVATRADADTITVERGVTLPTAGLNFFYKKRYYSQDPIDGWINVQGFKTFSVSVEVDANADTGGVVTSIECASAASGDLPTQEVVQEVDTDTIATGATGTNATSVILSELPIYTHCRAGIKFGTGDDADAANEDIDIVVGLSR